MAELVFDQGPEAPLQGYSAMLDGGHDPSLYVLWSTGAKYTQRNRHSVQEAKEKGEDFVWFVVHHGTLEYDYAGVRQSLRHHKDGAIVTKPAEYFEAGVSQEDRDKVLALLEAVTEVYDSLDPRHKYSGVELPLTIQEAELLTNAEHASRYLFSAGADWNFSDQTRVPYMISHASALQ